MDLWQLKIFIKVVETRSFSKASEEINLSQPTVSSHIKELEDHFQCRLLDRLGKESVPTRAGDVLYKWATRLIQLHARTEAAMHDFLGKISGTLTIGGSTIPSSCIIPKLIGPFKKKYPGISIEVTTGDTAQVIRDILDGRSEVGIVGGKSDNPQLSQEKLIKDEMMLIVPGGHQWAALNDIDVKSVLTLPFIGREKGSGTMLAVSRAISEAGFRPDDLNITARFGNTSSVIQGILNHVGVSILSPMAVEDYIRFGHLVALPVRGLDLTRYFYLTAHSRRAHSPVCREFITHTRAQFGAG